MFERPSHGETCLIISLGCHQPVDPEVTQEIFELARSAGAEVHGLVEGRLRAPNPRYFISSGRLQEIHEILEASPVDLLVFNHSLTPSQERNLESELKCRVLDRTGLILDIFAQRARTHEGKLQVELAQLKHLSTRLVRGWTHLERQKGGIGLRGPGETQLETDRRLLAIRVNSLKRQLDKVRRTRQQQRQSRARSEMPTVALVGYTNAGKSTLFNRLAHSEVYARDQLFATLDPTLRRIDLGSSAVILADTVGFIRDLPHELVAAFQSTLQETAEADLLLHVMDASAENADEIRHHVDQVLASIGAENVPCLEVYNKIDLAQATSPGMDLGEDGRPSRVRVSAKDGVGMDHLQEAIEILTKGHWHRLTVHLRAHQGRLRSRLYEQLDVVAEQLLEEGGWEIQVEAGDEKLGKLLSREPDLRACLLTDSASEGCSMRT